MPVLETKCFGPISFAVELTIEFPRGLPGFDERRVFLPVQIPDTAPIVFLQSVDEPSLCFPTLPVLAVDPQYLLNMTEEDRDLVGLSIERQPKIGDEVLCVAVLSLRETGPTANLLAPVVVNLSNHRAVQALAPESDYSYQHTLLPEEAPVCS
jgi:flagellar assembly factor FliW